ncbi:MAG: DUF6850 family outer membrane beta-barrel protein [Bacteroidales bacterium]
MKRYILAILLFAVCNSVFSQDRDTINSFPGIQSRSLEVASQLWLKSDNAAGLAFSNVSRGSFTYFDRNVSNGDYHRAQEGSSLKSLMFSSERYDKLSKNVMVRGLFNFSIIKEGDRAWSDVKNTYNSNPYIYGSSVKGNYETQQFDLNLKLYSRSSGKVNFGVTLDYHVSDISRQRDPRSRSYLLDYSLIPSLVYNLNKTSKLGLDLYYRFDKEKMPGLSTVQTDPNLKYYTFSGLENAIGRIGGYKGFSRQFISDFVGSSLQYSYEKGNVKWLISAGVDMQWQETLGDKKQSPGSYNSFNYRLMSNLIMIKGNYLHNIFINSKIYDGGANEFRQNLVSEKNPETGVITERWITVYTYKNRVINKLSEISAKWKIYSLSDNGRGYKWSAGIFGGFNNFSNNYYLPKSEFGASRVNFGLEGSYCFLKRGDRVVEFEGVLNTQLKTDSYLITTTQNEITENILIPDHEYYNMNTLNIWGSLKYSFPLKFIKSSKISGFARIYGGNIFAGNSINRNSAGLAIGILTF